MGLLLSVLVSYAGVKEALECYRHFIYGLIPEGDPDLEKLRIFYCDLLDRSPQNNSSSSDWKSDGGNGYLCLEDIEDNISARIKYYRSDSDSAPLLFGTKISSFGQDSIESVDNDRYCTLPQSASIETVSEQLNIDTETRVSDQDAADSSPSCSAEVRPVEDKLKWHYRPLSPSPAADTIPTPEIHFQSYEHSGFPIAQDSPYTEDFLRSLDGVKFRPLQRNDPSGRRRSYKKRNSSSSSTSSRASREEELKIFTSLEETEFETAKKAAHDYSSAPNLSANWNAGRRSRSRDKSEEAKRSTESIDKITEETRDKPHLKDIPKLDSFDEITEPKKTKETVSEDVEETNDEAENSSDFWGQSSDW